jgi:hypothetical protein
METDAATTRLIAKRDLEPFFQMLEEQSNVLSKDEWSRLVGSTKERIITAPEQYLSGLNKPSDDLTSIIDSVFMERLN